MLYQDWQKKIIPLLKRELKIKNSLAVPRVEKVVVSMGVAQERDDNQAIEQFAQELSLITGQKPKLCPAKKSISGFKLRKGQIVGLRVTLRGKRMYDFLEKIFALVLPRLRDFRGLPLSGFDKQANYNLGSPEQTVFPEIKTDKVKRIKGVGINIITSTTDQAQAKKLLSVLGMSFARDED